MKKIILKLVIIFLLLNITGCVNKKYENKLLEIKEKGKISLAVSPDYPPYEFYNAKNGNIEIIGADIYLAEQIAKKLNVELEIVQLSFDSLLPALTSGRVDMVISGMNETPERREVVDFSDTYYISGSSFLINKGTADFKNIDELKSKKIGVQKGTIQEKYLLEELKIPLYNIQSLADAPSLIQDLENKNIDAVFLTDDVSQITMNKKNFLEISKIKLEKNVETDGLAIAFAKGNNKELLQEVNAVIKEVLKDNSFEQKLKEYSKLVI